MRHSLRPCTDDGLKVPMTATSPGGEDGDGGGAGRKLPAGSEKVIATPPCVALSTGVAMGLR